jgi:NADH-quinone oxidoreductase subunit M
VDFPILTAIIAMPIVGAIVCLFTPAQRPEVARAVGYAATMVTFGLAGWLLWNFNGNNPSFQFVESEKWISSLGVRYIVGVDGISIFMVAITALLFPLGLLASEKYITHRVKAYIAWFLLLEGAIMGIFLALDLIAFFVFWEVMLVPMYFLIQGWGSGRREFAAMKFFIYTAAGSAFLLASTLALGFIHQADTGFLTFDFRVLAAWNGLSGSTEVLLFLGFMAAFAIKAPLFPFHTWLPLVHTEAPTAGSVVLAGVILKMGAYGLVRFSFELFPQTSVDLAPLLLVLAVIGIIYGAIVATMQTDLKRVIAYSSVAHMGFVVLGIFSLTTIGIDGAVFTMLSHPLTTGALFLLVGMLYERRHTREISAFRGVWKTTPILGGMFLAALFAGVGLPGFSGFIGEFLSLLGTFVFDRPYAIVATFGVIFAAVYSLWAFQRVFTGKPQGENAKMRDVSMREVIVVAPLLALSLFLGIYPKPALDRIEPTVRAKIARLEHKSDYREPTPPSLLKSSATSASGRGGSK